MSRKTLFIILILTAVAIAAAFIWYFFFRPIPPVSPQTGTFPTTGEVPLPPAVKKTTVLPPGAFKPILRKLTLTPIAGAVLGGRDKALVRYVDRATGNIMGIPAESGTARRITNTTIPKVYEALFAKSGATVILRYLKSDGETVETFLGNIRAGAAGGEGELVGTFLPTNIGGLALSADGSELLYTREDSSGGAAGVRVDLQSKKSSALWSSPLREWLPLSISPGFAAFLTKPSGLSPGIFVIKNRSSGQELPVLRNVRGLTALPNRAATKVLYGDSTASGVELNLLTLKNRSIAPIAEATLPEKCVFANNDADLYCAVPENIAGGTYPDAWYQGLVSFRDEVWKVGEKTNELILPVSSEAGSDIDAVNLRLGADEKFLIFTNKIDGMLWSLQLKP